jgi:hypothetical protein
VDKAAAEYQAALKIEPGNTDAAIKLKEVGRKQSGEHLACGGAARARRDRGRLTVVQQAAVPDSTRRSALDDANQQALKKAGSCWRRLSRGSR